jgi:hypothetical protein
MMLGTHQAKRKVSERTLRRVTIAARSAGDLFGSENR